MYACPTKACVSGVDAVFVPEKLLVVICSKIAQEPVFAPAPFLINEEIFGVGRPCITSQSHFFMMQA